MLSLPSLGLSGAPFFAAMEFPRGPGFYLNIPAFAAVVVVYLCWIRTCWWVDRDSRHLKQPTTLWNAIMLGSGFLGLLVVWLFPSSVSPAMFLLSFSIFLLLVLGPALMYVRVRNEGLEPDRRVLTVEHLRDLGARLLRMKRAKVEDGGKEEIPIRFMGKSAGGREEDPNRLRRAQDSRGYQAALQMVHDALGKRTTDIHLEPTKEEMTVRFRIDGILHATNPFSRAMGESVVNIFKVLSDMDITEKRKPQDGSFSAEVYGRPKRKPKKQDDDEENGDDAPEEPQAPASRQIDFRVATAGSVAGEKMVMRILDGALQMADLKRLGLRPKLREQLHQLAMQPHGLLIVCGPTGAGKSTTLYACLSEIDRYQKNVITVENPVEYNIPNVTQIEVNPKAGKTFASELRSILRQDPDVIYIGEIRDQETAEIACQAAQTGHMVFTTIHANDTVTALARLIDLGVAPFTVSGSVTAVLGQRLVRVLCPKCKRRYRPGQEILRKANLPADKIEYFYRPPPESTDGDEEADDDEKVRCPNCGGTGYRGRTGVYELLIITDKIRDLLRENPNLNAIRQEAVKNGMKYLQEDGLLQVIEGRTSIQELLRVCK
jgi:general secretion pathway protein E